MGRIRDILKETREYVQRFQEELPEVTAATAKLYDKVYQDGALSRQVKELIALAIAITLRCEPCIAHHINSALQAKATREQIVETLAVAIQMNGGPAIVQSPRVFQALEELAGSE
ncbi:hypothetical protein ES708_08724 [subsurface metagenome]